MNLRYFLHISPLLLGLVVPVLGGDHAQVLEQTQTQVLGSDHAALHADTTQIDDMPAFKAKKGEQPLSMVFVHDFTENALDLKALQKTAHKLSQQQQHVFAQIELLKNAQDIEKKHSESESKRRSEQQQQKEAKHKRSAAAVVIPGNGVFQETIEKEITDLDTEIEQAVDLFIGNDEKFYASKDLLKEKEDFLKKAWACSEDFSVKMAQNYSYGFKLSDDLHNKLILQRFKLDELKKIEEQKQKWLSKMESVSKQTPTYDRLNELEVIEAEIIDPKTSSITYECPNNKTLKNPCRGKMHFKCSSQLERYRNSTKNMLSIYINDLKSTIEAGIKKEIERQKELVVDVKAKKATVQSKAGTQIKEDNTWAMWKAFGATLAISATVALLVKSYFWWVSKSSAARA